VTDAGLEYLAKLDKLGLVILSGPKVTEAGVEKLKKALPSCKIELYEPEE
jgi:hypothetical protein